MAGPSEEALHLTAKCLVVVRGDGIQLQQPLGAPPLPLDLGGLYLLAAASAGPVTDLGGLMRRVAAETGASQERLYDLAFALRYAQLLMPWAPVEHAPVADDPAAAAASPARVESETAIALRLPQVLRPRAGSFELINPTKAGASRR